VFIRDRISSRESLTSKVAIGGFCRNPRIRDHFKLYQNAARKRECDLGSKLLLATGVATQSARAITTATQARTDKPDIKHAAFAMQIKRGDTLAVLRGVAVIARVVCMLWFPASDIYAGQPKAFVVG
jgi:hypothetical protein